MKYKNGGAFRRALETRLREQSLSSNLPLVRLRKMVAFDRLLTRIVQIQPNQWVLKGGLALQLRLGDRARTPKDIDLLFLDEITLSTIPYWQLHHLMLETGSRLKLEDLQTALSGMKEVFVTMYKPC